MTRCPHCDNEIHFYDAVIRAGGHLWHRACADEAFAAANWPRGRNWPEDFELESNRHQQSNYKAAYDYHIERNSR